MANWITCGAVGEKLGIAYYAQQIQRPRTSPNRQGDRRSQVQLRHSGPGVSDRGVPCGARCGAGAIVSGRVGFESRTILQVGVSHSS